MHTASSPHPRRAYWLKTLYEWHWVSSALCLVGMLVFAVTGFTLNHAGQIEAKSQTHTAQAQLPAVVLEPLQAAAQATAAQQLNAPIPEALQQWSQRTLGANLAHRTPEWSADELYIPLPRPGGDAWLRIDLESGGAEYESTDRGWISYFNDLHKGRHTGVAWSWFLDIFAAACLMFCLTGLFILYMHGTRRPMTWPLVGMGLVLPALLALLLVH
ncbi:PepSY-associated TM helix domain-containing protein [Comamonas aquatica]|uniref:PepSY-associated TM helix domain-containing protein n=1 Tax=Comamonas aquatica TaxID=225991 RepID=UPI0034D3CB4C